MCETKPNLGALGYLRDRTRDAGQIRQTNPIPRLRIGDRPAPPARAGRLRQTNPIWLVGWGSGGRNAQNRPNSGGVGWDGRSETRGEHAKRTQFPARRTAGTGLLYETKPISRGLGGTRPQGRRTRDKCAKQSQFGAAARPPGPVVQTKPIPFEGTEDDRQGLPALTMPPGRRWRGRLCETTPISAEGLIAPNKANFPPAGPLREAIVSNKANSLRGHGRPSPRPPALTMPPGRRWRGPVVRNKANSAQVSGRVSTWWKRSYGESYKQSQFGSDQPREKAGAAPWPAESLKALRVPPRTRRRSRLRGCEGGSRPLHQPPAERPRRSAAPGRLHPHSGAPTT
jgi:hypothetical protein